MASFTIETRSSKKTQKAAETLAKELPKIRLKHALVLALSGELGSGKTTFVRGLARGLGIRGKIKSPTFLIFKNYKLPRHNRSSRLFRGRQNTGYKLFVHIDAYRLTKPKDILALGWEKMASDPQNIIVIEWAGNIKKILPTKHFEINFKHISGDKRVIKFYAK